MMNKKLARLRRARKDRYKIRALEVARLVVHRTSQHMYAQVIAAGNQSVLATASTLDAEVRGALNGSTGNRAAAALVGQKIAERALQKQITKVAFDRSGFKYHGRVAALAAGAREAGLQF